MSYYALTKDRGEDPVYTYRTRWDADMIYGCVCDKGFSGPDCTIRNCPSGDDPLTGKPLTCIRVHDSELRRAIIVFQENAAREQGILGPDCLVQIHPQATEL